MPKFCSNCGAPLGENAKFCGECGASVSPSAVSASPAKPATAPVSASAKETLQSELFGLYEILGPVRELDLAGRAIDAKIAELSAKQSEANEKFHLAFVRYFPFISVELPENLIIPKEKWEKMMWKSFIKAQDERINGVKRFHKPTPVMYEYVYKLFKNHKAEVMKDLGGSFLYYKMQFCYDNPPDSHFWSESVLVDKIINTKEFFKFLGEKLGDKRDEYIYDICTKLGSANYGHEDLFDEMVNYQWIKVDGEYDSFFKPDYGFPKELYGSHRITIYDHGKLSAAGKKVMLKSIHTKKELDGAVAGLRAIRAKIDAAIAEYMKNPVDGYIAKNVPTVPVSYAKNWESVAYFLYLIVNKRGRDIYEVVNQYEIDMKHQELTSALLDIRDEINNQTAILSSKLDEVKKAVVQMASSISYAISKQTATLQKSLSDINYSVISTGASVTGAISSLSSSMTQAMSNMKVNVSIN